MSKRVKYLKKIIRVRKKIIELKKCGVNRYAAIIKIQEIEKYVKAYEKKASEDYWKKFMNRRKSDILFLIPSNKAQETYLEELNELL